MAGSDFKQSEFKHLTSKGLVIHKTEPDGNCLFRALSDQLYGNFNEHAKVRRIVVAYLRAHPDDIKPFMNVDFVERNSPRRSRARRTSPVDNEAASEEALEKVFQEHCNEMSLDGKWGTQFELNAASNAFGINISVWQSDATVVSHTADSGVRVKRHLHIAFDAKCNHYSSIRDAGGPTKGLPATKYGAKAKVEKAAVTSALVDVVAADVGKKVVSKNKQKISAGAKPLKSKTRADSTDSLTSSSSSASKKRARDDSDDAEERRQGSNKRRSPKPAKAMSPLRLKLRELARTPIKEKLTNPIPQGIWAGY